MKYYLFGVNTPHLACGVHHAQAAQSNCLVLVVGSRPGVGAARSHNRTRHLRGVSTASG